VRRIESLAAVPRVSDQYGAPFISYEVAPKEPEALAVKHALDLILSALLVVLLSPLLLALALAILVRMGRPLLFAQERAGLNGRRFRMLKFRTMVRGAEERRDDFLGRNEMDGPVFKLADDPRVTPLGRLLRRFSLDELPQLFNVLAGDMSLVGPRPLPVREQVEIRGAHRRRLSMKPGITGLWQVSGRNDLGFDEWMRLDLLYVDTWSLGLDLRILLRTLPAVLTARGSR
jgi:lipopolysaccharide/colanic/teichoic acid biosynthesis glycosyltransferase